MPKGSSISSFKVGFAADVTQQSKLYSAKECVATQTARILSFVVYEVIG
jgi:hypothetical protein